MSVFLYNVFNHLDKRSINGEAGEYLWLLKAIEQAMLFCELQLEYSGEQKWKEYIGKLGLILDKYSVSCSKVCSYYIKETL